MKPENVRVGMLVRVNGGPYLIPARAKSDVGVVVDRFTNRVSVRFYGPSLGAVIGVWSFNSSSLEKAFP